MTQSEPASELRSPRLAALLLALLTLAAYLPAVTGGFIWDDNVYVFGNPLVRAPDGLRDIWLTAKTIEYYPLFYTSFWLEWRLWGMNATGYHVTNILLHIASTLLIWRLLLRLRIPGAWWAALIFALHPVNVESVAWISERKNTLSLFFFLLASHTWLGYEIRPRRRWYGLTLLLFFCALASKTSVLVFPFVQLGIAWWLRGRIGSRDLRRAAPFFGLALAMGLLLIWFLPHRFPVADGGEASGLLERLASGGVAFWFYLWKAALPVGLCLVYPHWRLEMSQVVALVPLVMAAVGFAALSWLAWRRPGWPRAVLLGVGFFGLALAPALGFVEHPYLKQAPVADRWQYLPLIGLTALVAAAAVRWYRQRVSGGGQAAPTARTARMIRVGAVAVVAVLFALTFARARLFADAERLNRATLVCNPRAVAIRNNLGLLLIQQDQKMAGMRELQRAVATDPTYAQAQNNLGNLLQEMGRYDEAVEHLTDATRLDPGLAPAWLNLGTALAALGRSEEAIGALQNAVTRAPSQTEVRLQLASVLVQAGRTTEAEFELREVLRRQPGRPDALELLARSLVGQGQSREAAAIYRDLLRKHPGAAGIWVNLGNLQAAMGESGTAVESFQRALKIDAQLPGALNNLAWLLATTADDSVRDGPAAVASAEKLVGQKGGDDPRYQQTLAAAYAAAGRHSEAVTVVTRLLDRLGSRGDPRLRTELEAQRTLYDAGRSYTQQR